MNKIPVGRTLAEAFRFTFTFAGLEKIIALIWLPVVTLTVGGYFVMAPQLGGMASALESGDMARQGPMIATLFMFELVALILIAVVAVAITREILNPLKRPVFLRFGLGGMEFRVVGAMIGIYILFLLFLIGWMIVAMVLGYLLNVVLPAGTGILADGVKRTFAFGVLIALVLSPALLYLLLRLAFFVVPSVVVDGKFGIERSWKLSKGNFWRILGITLAVGIPVVLVSVAIQAAVLGVDSLNPHFELIGHQAARMQQQAVQMHRLADNMPLLMGLNFLLAPFTYGLMFSAPAFAYKAVTAIENT